MKPEHVTEFLERYESNPLEGLGITVNLRGQRKPLENQTPDQVRIFLPGLIVALSAIYAPAVPFPPGTRLTKAGVYFQSHAAGLEYLLEAIQKDVIRLRKPDVYRVVSYHEKEKALKLAPGRVRKMGKSWRICNKPEGGRLPVAL